MAHHKSAIKRSRQNEKRRAHNRQHRSSLRTNIKNLETAIQSSDQAAIKDLLPATISNIHKAASKGLIHKNKAARNVSRLTRKAAAVRPA